MKIMMAVATLTLGGVLTGCGVGYMDSDDSDSSSHRDALRGRDGGTAGTVVKQRTCELYKDKVSCFADSRCEWITIASRVFFDGRPPPPTGVCSNKVAVGGGSGSDSSSGGVPR